MTEREIIGGKWEKGGVRGGEVGGGGRGRGRGRERGRGGGGGVGDRRGEGGRGGGGWGEQTSEDQDSQQIPYADFCLKRKPNGKKKQIGKNDMKDTDNRKMTTVER